MKTKIPLALGILALVSILNAQLSTLFAQGTAFTYQGRLNDGANPANGIYDLRFALYDAGTNGSVVAGPLTSSPTGVTNGLFTTTLDFGASVFTGNARWLEIAVRTNGGGAFTTLAPRQPLTPSPYALYAPSAGVAASANGVTASSVGTAALVPGAVDSSRIADGSIAASDLSPALASNTFWRLGGNSGTTPGTHFLGTTDNQALEIKVNGIRALRLEPTANDSNHSNIINVVNGSPVNFVAPGIYGATIGGGGAVLYGGIPATNQATGDFATVAGGVGNTAGGILATVGGGRQNTSSGFAATVGGGLQNTSSGDVATILGGYLNGASGYLATVGGGQNNAAGGVVATIPGGYGNVAFNYAFAAGYRAKANHEGSFVWADFQNADFASTANNQFLIRAAGGVGINTPAPGAMLQLGDVNTPGSQGMMRFASRSGTGPANRYWDIGVPNGNESLLGKFYSFAIDDPQVGSGPEFLIRWDTGFIGIGTTNPVSALQVIGTVTATAFNPTSDRNLKENFAAVKPREVLDKVAGLTISRWNFKGDAATPHVGPMAQDFHAAFGLGTDDKHIATVDADGVALAAIQGLNQKVDSETATLRAENAELKQRLEKLEQLMNHKNGGAK